MVQCLVAVFCTDFFFIAFGNRGIEVVTALESQNHVYCGFCLKRLGIRKNYISRKGGGGGRLS
ncbi:unnamed protein product [Ixodes pacificus]